MANRIILGKSTNSNLGHSGGKFGLYISRTGDDITNCTADQLIFNTDNVGNTSAAIDVGQYKIIPITGTTATASVSVSASSSATINFANLGINNILFTNFSTAITNLSDNNQSATISRFVNGGLTTSTTAGTINNLGNTAATISVSVMGGFSSAALF
tara:strand:- start:75 stop:545 length:471 start_codon:yes stop_codon:yes gene_type:complete